MERAIQQLLIMLILKMEISWKSMMICYGRQAFPKSMKVLEYRNQCFEIINSLRFLVSILEFLKFLKTLNKNLQRVYFLFWCILHSIFIIIMLFLLDLTPNRDNTRDLHRSMRGNVNLEVAFKDPTKKTITVLMYTASSGRINIGKDYDIQMLSSDY